MCFGKTWSAISLTILLTTNAAIWYLRGSSTIIIVLLFVAVKELIQFLLYQDGLKSCTKINTFLTTAAWYHICFQPFIMNLFFSALSLRSKMYHIPLILSLVYAFFNLFALNTTSSSSTKKSCPTDLQHNMCRTKTCSLPGLHHLAYGFHLKSADKSAFTPNFFTYNLLSFTPAFIIGDYLLATIHLLVATLSFYFTQQNIGEGAAIWCVNSFWLGLAGLYYTYYKNIK